MDATELDTYRFLDPRDSSRRSRPMPCIATRINRCGGEWIPWDFTGWATWIYQLECHPRGSWEARKQQKDHTFFVGHPGCQIPWSLNGKVQPADPEEICRLGCNAWPDVDHKQNYHAFFDRFWLPKNGRSVKMLWWTFAMVKHRCWWLQMWQPEGCLVMVHYSFASPHASRVVSRFLSLTMAHGSNEPMVAVWKSFKDNHQVRIYQGFVVVVVVVCCLLFVDDRIWPFLTEVRYQRCDPGGVSRLAKPHRQKWSWSHLMASWILGWISPGFFPDRSGMGPSEKFKDRWHLSFWKFFFPGFQSAIEGITGPFFGRFGQTSPQNFAAQNRAPWVIVEKHAQIPSLCSLDEPGLAVFSKEAGLDLTSRRATRKRHTHRDIFLGRFIWISSAAAPWNQPLW